MELIEYLSLFLSENYILLQSVEIMMSGVPQGTARSGSSIDTLHVGSDL